MKSLSFFVALFVGLQLRAGATTSVVCQNYDIENVSAQSCSRIPSNWDQKQIIYHLHGSGGNTQTWDQISAYGNALKQLEAEGKPIPVVVSISFGQWWLLKDFGADGKPALLNVFLKIQKQIETNLFNSKLPEKRIVIGESMGSYNALLLLSKTDLHFDKAALLCAGVAAVGPYSTPEEIRKYIERNRPYISEKTVEALMATLKEEFPTEQRWQTHAPFYLTKNIKDKNVEYYVTGNTQDQFGFGEGDNLLQADLKKQGFTVKYEVIPGPHCAMNAKSIAEFLK